MRALIALFATAALGAPATADAQLGDPVRLDVGASARVVDDTLSGPGRGLALALDRRQVAYQDATGRWHRFATPDAVGVQLVALEQGSGLAVWGSGSTVYGRRWHRDGRLDAAVVLLVDVQTFDGYGPARLADPGWKLSADGQGTVVIAAQGDAAHLRALSASVRLPGGEFASQQLLPPAMSSTEPDDLTRLMLRLDPMTPDGTATLSWATSTRGLPPVHSSGRATRAGGTGRFGPPAPAEWRRDTAPEIVRFGDEELRAGAALMRICSFMCEGKRFSWSNGQQRLAVRQLGVWYVARRQGDGSFDDPRRATHTGGLPVWTPRPGVVAFVKATGSPARGVHAVPFGVRPRRAPRIMLGRVGRDFDLPVACSTACRVSVSVRGRRAHSELLEPLETALLDPATPRARRVRVTLTARGERGTSRRTVELRRGKDRRWRATR